MLTCAADVVLKSTLAGTKANAYWRHVVAPEILTMTQHYRQLARREAYKVSMSIIPYTHADELISKVMQKPSRAVIPWDALVDQYGVDRQYVAISMLAALERKAKDPDTLVELTRQRADSFSLLSQCLGLFVPNISLEFIRAMAETGRFPNTLARFSPEQTVRLAAEAAARLARKRQGERIANRKYKEGETWAGWRQMRAAQVRTKAAEIAAALGDIHTANPAHTHASNSVTSLVKTLADLAKPKGTTRRPPLAAVLVYFHKHVLPALRSGAQTAPHAAAIATRVNAEAAALGQRIPPTLANHPARCVISELASRTTGERFEPVWDGDADPRLKPLLSTIASE